MTDDSHSSAFDLNHEASTEQRILGNALKQFCDFGYNGTSVREITASAEVTKPTLYYYFKNKEELFKKLAEDCFGALTAQLNAIDVKPKDCIGNFIQYFEGLQTVFKKDPLILKFIFVVTFTPQRGMPDVGTKVAREFEERVLRAIIDQGIKDGDINEQSAENIALMVGALKVYYATSLLAGNMIQLDNRQKIRELIVSILASSKVNLKSV